MFYLVKEKKEKKVKVGYLKGVEMWVNTKKVLSPRISIYGMENKITMLMLS